MTAAERGVECGDAKAQLIDIINDNNSVELRLSG